MKIIFATGNKNKMTEIRQILRDLGMEILSMKEAGIDVDIVEDGTTFEENALIKGKAVAAHCNDIVLADDSGLEIDYLNKEPGIYSARYAGTDTSYDIKNSLLLSRMKGAPDKQRTARFVCAIAAVMPDGALLTTEGTGCPWNDGRMYWLRNRRSKWIWLRSDLFPAGIRLHLGRACTGKEE